MLIHTCIFTPRPGEPSKKVKKEKEKIKKEKETEKEDKEKVKAELKTNDKEATQSSVSDDKNAAKKPNEVATDQ